jgi:hypothetical protein
MAWMRVFSPTLGNCQMNEQKHIKEGGGKAANSYMVKNFAIQKNFFGCMAAIHQSCAAVSTNPGLSLRISAFDILQDFNVMVAIREAMEAHKVGE